MKYFLSTNFFLALKEAVQKGTDVDALILKQEYEAFACLLFGKTVESSDKAVFLNTLCYTRVELASLQKRQGVEKKYIRLAGQSY
jgi:hypothetical protein